MVNHNYFTQRDVERLEEQAVQIRQDIISRSSGEWNPAFLCFS